MSINDAVFIDFVVSLRPPQNNSAEASAGLPDNVLSMDGLVAGGLEAQDQHEALPLANGCNCLLSYGA